MATDTELRTYVQSKVNSALVPGGWPQMGDLPLPLQPRHALGPGSSSRRATAGRRHRDTVRHGCDVNKRRTVDPQTASHH